MDTILNLGLNDETVGGLIRLTKNERFVYDAYRRLIQLFGSVGLGIDDEKFDSIFAVDDTENSDPNVSKMLADSDEVECRPYRSRTCDTLIKSQVLWFDENPILISELFAYVLYSPYLFIGFILTVKGT